MKTPEEIFNMATDDSKAIMTKFETYTEMRSYLAELRFILDFNQLMRGAMDAFIKKEKI